MKANMNADQESSDLSSQLQSLANTAKDTLYKQVGGKTEILCSKCKRQIRVAEARPKILTKPKIADMIVGITKDGDFIIEMGLCCPECCKEL
jgi:hypothetical protein